MEKVSNLQANYQHIDSLNGRPNSEVTSSSEQATKQQFTVNMNSISKNELKALELSGIETGILDRFPVKAFFDSQGNFDPSGGFGENDKMNLLTMLQEYTLFLKSKGLPTDFEDRLMNKYLKVHGNSYKIE